MQTICVPLIMFIVYAIIEILKSCIKSQKFLNFIPIIAGGIGAVLGIVGFFIPNFMNCTNVLEALLIGICSGLSATGSNQIIKQLKELGANSNSNTSGTSNSTNQNDSTNSATSDSTTNSTNKDS